MASVGRRAVGPVCRAHARGSAHRTRLRTARRRGLAEGVALPPTAARRASGRSALPPGGGAHRADGEPRAAILVERTRTVAGGFEPLAGYFLTHAGGHAYAPVHGDFPLGCTHGLPSITDRKSEERRVGKEGR